MADNKIPDSWLPGIQDNIMAHQTGVLQTKVNERAEKTAESLFVLNSFKERVSNHPSHPNNKALQLIASLEENVKNDPEGVKDIMYLFGVVHRGFKTQDVVHDLTPDIVDKH